MNRHRWCVPELLRIKGEVLLRQTTDLSILAAEDCFNQAAQMAGEQGALFWELRVALSLARLPIAVWLVTSRSSEGLIDADRKNTAPRLAAT